LFIILDKLMKKKLINNIIDKTKSDSSLNEMADTTEN